MHAAKGPSAQWGALLKNMNTTLVHLTARAYPNHLTPCDEDVGPNLSQLRSTSSARGAVVRDPPPEALTGDPGRRLPFNRRYISTGLHEYFPLRAARGGQRRCTSDGSDLGWLEPVFLLRPDRHRLTNCPKCIRKRTLHPRPAN